MPPTERRRNGDYYEITNVEMYVYDILPKEKVEQLKVGDTVPKYGGIYVLKNIDTYWGDKFYDFEPENGKSGPAYYLRECDEGYYQVSDSDAREEKTIYTGTIYMTEDCKVSILDFTEDLGREDGLQDISLEKFIALGFQNEYISAQGTVELDSAGYVVEYHEYFKP